jgi:hypothetical protein
LPQAAAWSEGDLYALARRASLEDDLAAPKSVDRFDLGEVFGIANERAAMRRIEAMVAAPAVTVRRRLAIMREARALDDRYGLTAKGSSVPVHAWWWRYT